MENQELSSIFEGPKLKERARGRQEVGEVNGSAGRVWLD